jgi:hypothetical protein
MREGPSSLTCVHEQYYVHGVVNISTIVNMKALGCARLRLLPSQPGRQLRRSAHDTLEGLPAGTSS